MQQLALLNPESASNDEVNGYRIREAARAVVSDNDGNIALLHVASQGYYKLPGGGLEADEDRIAALRRECKEEIGCDIEVRGEVGSIVEYRKIFNLKQTSYCYLALVTGPKGVPSFTESERTDGFEVEWLTYDQALQKLKESNTDDLEGGAYIVPRDIAFLQAAQKIS